MTEPTSRRAFLRGTPLGGAVALTGTDLVLADVVIEGVTQ